MDEQERKQQDFDRAMTVLSNIIYGGNWEEFLRWLLPRSEQRFGSEMLDMLLVVM